MPVSTIVTMVKVLYIGSYSMYCKLNMYIDNCKGDFHWLECKVEIHVFGLYHYCFEQEIHSRYTGST